MIPIFLSSAPWTCWWSHLTQFLMQTSQHILHISLYHIYWLEKESNEAQLGAISNKYSLDGFLGYDVPVHSLALSNNYCSPEANYFFVSNTHSPVCMLGTRPPDSFGGKTKSFSTERCHDCWLLWNSSKHWTLWFLPSILVWLPCTRCKQGSNLWCDWG